MSKTVDASRTIYLTIDRLTKRVLTSDPTREQARQSRKAYNEMFGCTNEGLTPSCDPYALGRPPARIMTVAVPFYELDPYDSGYFQSVR